MNVDYPNEPKNTHSVLTSDTVHRRGKVKNTGGARFRILGGGGGGQGGQISSRHMTS